MNSTLSKSQVIFKRPSTVPAGGLPHHFGNANEQRKHSEAAATATNASLKPTLKSDLASSADAYTFTVPNPVPTYSKCSTANRELWRQNTINEIKLNNGVIDASDKNIFYSKHVDPLTNLREILRTLSNKDAFKYMRQCRLVVAKLKKSWVEVNEEIKSLTRNKQYLESAIDHIRKDIIINQEIIDGRVHRPQRETFQDSVDDALTEEKKYLVLLKRNLELILKPIQDHLYILDDTREILYKLCKERSAVTDLICQCLTQSIRNYDRATSALRSNANLLYKSTGSLNSLQQRQQNAEANDMLKSNNLLYTLTNDSIEIMNTAKEQIAVGQDLRNKSLCLMKECFDNAKSINSNVDESFVRKIADTLGLNQNLVVSTCENRTALNRSVRWQELNEYALKYAQGPEKATNLKTYEQLDRPIIKNFQKHPGNQVPEAQEIIKGTEKLTKSLEVTQNQIKSIKIIGKKLNANIKDKEAEMALDSKLLRRRRELSDHRWVPPAMKYVRETTHI